MDKDYYQSRLEKAKVIFIS